VFVTEAEAESERENNEFNERHNVTESDFGSGDYSGAACQGVAQQQQQQQEETTRPAPSPSPSWSTISVPPNLPLPDPSLESSVDIEYCHCNCYCDEYCYCNATATACFLSPLPGIPSLSSILVVTLCVCVLNSATAAQRQWIYTALTILFLLCVSVHLLR